MKNLLRTLSLLALLAPTLAVADVYNPVQARQAWITVAKLEQTNGIPRGLLHAISLAETGKGIDGKIMPWPYTVGVNSPGTKTAQNSNEAVSIIRKYQALGFNRYTVTVNGQQSARLSTLAATNRVMSARGTIKVKPQPYPKRFANARAAANFAESMVRRGYRNMDIGLMQINWRFHSGNFTNLAEAFDPYHNANYAVSYLTKHKQTRDWWGSVGRYHSGTPKFANRYIERVYSMYKKLHNIG